MGRILRDLAALAARLGVGGIFFANGWHKLEAGLNATTEQFAVQGAPLPRGWATVTMLTELVGGTLLVAGLIVPVAALVLFAEALAVFLLAGEAGGHPLTGGDANLLVALGAASVLLAVVGAGRLSVDHMVVIRRRESAAAEEFAADREAEAALDALREPRPEVPPAPPAAASPGPPSALTPPPAPAPPPGPASAPPSGPAPGPEREDAGATAEFPVAGEAARRRRTGGSGAGAAPGPADAAGRGGKGGRGRSAAPGDRLVAGVKKPEQP